MLGSLRRPGPGAREPPESYIPFVPLAGTGQDEWPDLEEALICLCVQLYPDSPSWAPWGLCEACHVSPATEASHTRVGSGEEALL